MKAFIELTLTGSGQPVLINVNHIVCVEQFPDGTSVQYLGGMALSVRVMEEYGTVVDLIKQSL
jgi:uncharacterized protein YlzI (FlbEa/FlbD family)